MRRARPNARPASNWSIGWGPGDAPRWRPTRATTPRASLPPCVSAASRPRGRRLTDQQDRHPEALCCRRPHDASSRISGQPACSQTDRRSVRLDQICCRAPPDQASRPAARRVGLRFGNHGLQLDPAAKTIAPTCCGTASEAPTRSPAPTPPEATESPTFGLLQQPAKGGQGDARRVAH